MICDRLTALQQLPEWRIAFPRNCSLELAASKFHEDII